MDRHGCDATVTHFAPAARAGDTELAKDRRAFSGVPNAELFLEMMPDGAFALNGRRQIVAAARRLLDKLGLERSEQALGVRPGEAVGCLHADEEAAGCGTSRACAECGAVGTIMRCMETREPAEGECRIITSASADGGALDLRVTATYLEAEGRPFVVVALRDISGDKRRQALERVVLESVHGGLIGVHQVAQLIDGDGDDPDARAALVADLRRIAKGMLDELQAYQYLLRAERNELRVTLQDVYLPDLVHAVAHSFEPRALAGSITLCVPDVTPTVISTDVSLATHALSSLLRNAVEATRPGGVVAMTATESDAAVELGIHNPGIMPEPVQLQVFQRSFSTKGGTGRGLGTYSARLFVERFLGGHVSFSSGDPDGTTFRIELPRDAALAV